MKNLLLTRELLVRKRTRDHECGDGMMKKVILFLFCGLLILSFTACGREAEQDNRNDDVTDTLREAPENRKDEGDVTLGDSAENGGADTGDGAVGQQEENADTGASEENSILVAYFSLADEQYEVGVIEKGNTQIIAEIIADQIGADTFSIESTVAYPTTYNGLLEVSREEGSNPPEIAGTVENMDDYSVILIGYPIWWGDLPTIVKVFLESYDFSGKTVIPFCTHAGSGLSGTQRTVEDLCTGATVENGLAVRGRTAQNERDSAESAVTDWLRGLGYIE